MCSSKVGFFISIVLGNSNSVDMPPECSQLVSEMHILLT